MNARSRTARQIIVTRRAASRAAKKPHTLKSHCLRAGLDGSTAGSVAGALRAKSKVCGIAGREVRMFRRNHAGQKMWKQPVTNARRYSHDEFRTLASAYSPRAAKYAAARQSLLASR